MATSFRDVKRNTPLILLPERQKHHAIIKRELGERAKSTRLEPCEIPSSRGDDGLLVISEEDLDLRCAAGYKLHEGQRELFHRESGKRMFDGDSICPRKY